MKNEMIWASLMHLSTNMWGEEGESTMNAPFHSYLTTEDTIWKKSIDFFPQCGINAVLIDVGDGIEYESHPEINIRGAWSKDKLKKELDRMREMGLTPYPKLNFSTRHHAWLKEYSRKVSTPVYYQVVEDLIKEVAEAFDYPKLFHLGLDEEGMFMSRDMMQIVRPMRLWWHDVNFMFDVCDKVGARPWIWADKCWYYPEEFVEKMSRDVVLSNYWYNHMARNPDGSFKKYQAETYRILEKAGFDQIPTCSSIEGCWYSAKETMELGRDEIDPERLKGYMTASWWFAYDRYLYGIMHDAHLFRRAKELVYPNAK